MAADGFPSGYMKSITCVYTDQCILQVVWQSINTSFHMLICTERHTVLKMLRSAEEAQVKEVMENTILTISIQDLLSAQAYA